MTTVFYDGVEERVGCYSIIDIIVIEFGDIWKK